MLVFRMEEHWTFQFQKEKLNSYCNHLHKNYSCPETIFKKVPGIFGNFQKNLRDGVEF